MPLPALNTFAAIRGHDRVREFLQAAVRRDRLPHALLFAGPEGVGKRSCALALVAWLLCERGGDDACGRCASCRQVAVLSHPDFELVTVLRGKKEIGIDRARDIKRFTQLQPVSGRVKVAVVDDAHVLTIAAQNALLKTLEEPAERSLLILVANTPDALLPTVRSRCQRIQFAPLSAAAVADILIAKHGMDPSTARELATLSEGSPGRALALGSARASGPQPSDPLAGVRPARYVRVMQMTNELSRPEGETDLKLEMLLSQYRNAAIRAVRDDDPTSSHPALQRILRQADAVRDACGALRRGNPNRQLLLEALLLRLARV